MKFQELPENDRDLLVLDGVAFLRSITEVYGADEGMKVWDGFCTSVDPELKGQIFLSVLTGANHRRLTLYGDKNMRSRPNTRFVESIKCIRNYTGMGLKEAKDAADAVDAGQNVMIDLSPTYYKDGNHVARSRSEAIREFRILGVRAA